MTNDKGPPLSLRLETYQRAAEISSARSRSFKDPTHLDLRMAAVRRERPRRRQQVRRSGPRLVISPIFSLTARVALGAERPMASLTTQSPYFTSGGQ
jgi:hypothetical protein